MYNNERVIRFDENGSPYIAHAGLFGKSSGKKDTKYVDKIKDNKGKTRYFYTQEEIKAYYDNLKGKASNAVQNASNTVRNLAGRAKANFESTSGVGARRNMERAKSEALEATKRSQQSVNDAAKLRNMGERSNGIDWHSTESEARAAGDATDKATRDMHEAAQKRREVKLFTDIYKDTPLGKLESSLNNAKSAYNKAQGTLKQAASDTMNKVREATGLAAKDRRDAASTNYIEKAAKEEAAYERYADSPEQNKIREALGRELIAYGRQHRARERANTAAESGNTNEASRQNELAKRANASAAKASFDYDRAREKANDLIDAWDDAEHEKRQAKAEYDTAKKAYENSPAGRVENAVKVTKAEYNKLQNKLREAGELSQAEMQKLFAYIQDNYSKK